jgi:hypothetical protein
VVKTLYSGTNDTKHINCHYCFSFDLHYFPITSVNVIHVIQNILHKLIVISVPYMWYQLVLINLTCGLHPTSYIIFIYFLILKIVCYVPFVVIAIRSFPHSWLITGCVTRVTRRVSHVEQELLTLLEHRSSPPIFSSVYVPRSLVFCAMLNRSLFVLETLLIIQDCHSSCQ